MAGKVISIEEGFRVLARRHWSRMLPEACRGDEMHADLDLQGIEPIFVDDDLYEELYVERKKRGEAE